MKSYSQTKNCWKGNEVFPQKTTQLNRLRCGMQRNILRKGFYPVRLNSEKCEFNPGTLRLTWKNLTDLAKLSIIKIWER